MSDVIIARAAVLYRAGTPLSIEDVRVLPPQRGEVRVRMKTAGVCHSDLHVIKGDLVMPLPVICGHEGSGVIESVGEAVTSVRPGDRVIPIWRASCGQCGYCLAGRPALCEMGTRMRFEGVMPDGTKRFETATGQPIHHYAGVSTFASFSTMPEAAVVKIPDDYGFEHAGLLSCGVITGVGAVTRAARIDPGCTVAVFGVGGIGLNIVQGARMMSARRIIAVDVHASKEAKAREMGATDFVLAEEGTDPVAAVRSLTGGLGVDYAFESVGLAAPVEQAYDSTRKGGTCVVAGIMRPDARARININQLVYAEKTLKGTPAGPHFSSRPGRLRSAEHSRRPQTNAGAGRSTTSHHPAIRQSPRIPGGAGPAIKRTADAVDLGSQGAACGCEISLGKTAKAQRAQRGRKGNSWRARNFLAKRDKMLELIFAS